MEHHPSSSNITHCHVPSRVRAWFHDSAGDIDFYQVSLSQLESTILHENIIYDFVKIRDDIFLAVVGFLHFELTQQNKRIELMYNGEKKI